jgi:hypothetical protein
VLAAFEDARGVYGEAIARALGELRPDLEVRRAPLAEIGRGLWRFDPHAVVCSQLDGERPGGRGVRVQVPPTTGRQRSPAWRGSAGIRKVPRQARYSTS